MPAETWTMSAWTFPGSGRRRLVVQGQQAVRRNGPHRVGVPFVVAELDQDGRRLEDLDHRADLTSREVGVGQDLDEVAAEVADRLLRGGGELVTVVSGAEDPDGQVAERLAAWV